MIKIITIPILILFSILNGMDLDVFSSLNSKEYEENLDVATELYLSKKDIPNEILLCLVPNDFSEFELYYGTTYPDNKMVETDFFYETTRRIFEQVTIDKNEAFYLPSIKLISFADGEFAEEFTNYLELIIEMDKTKFCNAISGKEYVNSNPIKWYSENNNCK